MAEFHREFAIDGGMIPDLNFGCYRRSRIGSLSIGIKGGPLLIDRVVQVIPGDEFLDQAGPLLVGGQEEFTLLPGESEKVGDVLDRKSVV